MSINSSNVDTKYENRNTQGSIKELVDALKDNIFRYLNVATFAKVKSINLEEGTCKVEPFPLIKGEYSKSITCFTTLIPTLKDNEVKFEDINNYLSVNDVVLVLFVNRDSLTAFKQAKKEISISTLLENTNLHSDSFGVVISICYKSNQGGS